MNEGKTEYVVLEETISNLIGEVQNCKEQLDVQTEQLKQLLDTNLNVLATALAMIKEFDEMKRETEFKQLSLFDDREWMD